MATGTVIKMDIGHRLIKTEVAVETAVVSTKISGDPDVPGAMETMMKKDGIPIRTRGIVTTTTNGCRLAVTTLIGILEQKTNLVAMTLMEVAGTRTEVADGTSIAIITNH